MRHFLLWLCISIAVYANAQQKIQYTGSVEGGVLKGDRPASSFVFTTQGIACKQYTFSAGSGIDFYPFRSVPLFIEVKKKFSHKPVQPFVQAAAGINFISAGSKDAQLYHRYVGEGHFDNGFFAKGGGGLIFRANKKWKIALSAGYTYKTFAYTYKQPATADPWFWQYQLVNDKYHYNRWYTGVGVMW